MIQTGFESRVKIQDIISNQIPEFILDESPKFSDFLKQYYISQEYQGGTVDIVENLDQYQKLDNLTPEVVVGFTKLTNDISSSVGVVTVTSTKGYPSKYGLLKIDDEIITYSGITTNTFTGCIRGFSGITSYHADLNNEDLVFSTSTASSHSSGSSVQNLSALFLQEFYKKTKYTLTPELEDLNFTPNLNVGNFIKSSRSLYESKGTDESFRILFNVLFGETPKVIDLEQFLLKPSSATYTRREVVVAEAISGDPLKLSGQTIFKNTDSNSSASVSEVEIIRRGGKTYYKLFLFIGYDDAFPTVTGTFNITGSTKNIEPVSIGGSIITVDSTIGFAPSGKIYSGINTITYTSKSVNQFFGCSGITSSISTSSVIRSDEIYYGYEDGDKTKKVELRLTGVLSKYVPVTQTSSIEIGETISVKNIGENIKNPIINPTYKEIFANSWIYNTSSRYEIDTFASGSISQVNVKSNIDKSSLKVGDIIEILNQGSESIVASNLTITQITGKQITTNNSFTLNQSFNYDIRRKLKNANSSTVPLEFTPITADIQNVYNESDNYMYVASNSLPSYTITKALLSYNASGITTATGYDSNTNTYSIVKFSTPVSFFNGSEVYYKPSATPISGLAEGIYYVQLLDSYSVRLYTSRSVIGTNNYIKLQAPLTGSLPTGTHNFSLNTQKEGKISPQKILRKFPLLPNIGDGKSDLTEPGHVGMLINGVEISGYKTLDKIYYGPISSVDILNQGDGYDVINPPLLTFSSGTALVEPVVSGSVEKIYVDPQDFNIDVVVSATLTGGNGTGSSFEPVLELKNREIPFDAREIGYGGGIDINAETITFLSNHNLIDGQPIIYNPQNNPSLGIGTFNGSNIDSGLTLNKGTTYITKYISDTTIQLYKSQADYQSGINTVGFTTFGTAGIHQFLTEPKKTLSTIKVLNGGSGYTNRKLRILPVGVSTANNTLYFPNHGFKDGERVVYSNVGVTTSSSSSPISGISTLNQYYILKEDNNTFKLANAGVGGTIRTDYERRKNISIGSTGIGYHIFNYPPISFSVEYSAVGLGSTQYRGTINAVPVIRGKIIDNYVYNAGTGYGSTILNYHNKPTITVKNGKFAKFIPVVVNGGIKEVTLQYKGTEYYSTPELVVSGVGTGAILRPVIEDNKITSVIVVNPGIGYSQENTSVVAVSAGKNALFDVQVRSISVDNNRLYDDVNDSALLANEIIRSSTNNLQYSVSGYFGSLQSSFNDTGVLHSPIIGWAYDGNPIYGSYGYTDPKNKNSPIKRLVSGYSASLTNIEDRPSGFDLRFFVEDYKFTNSGDLDEYNGRFCVTPEFPNGVYAYFATSIVDGNGNTVGSFPYFVGDRYRSKFVRENKTLNQSFDFNSSSLIRNTFPYKVNETYANNDFLVESNEIINQLALVESVTSGSIDDFRIVKSGSNYKVGDLVEFDESNSGGSGLIVAVSEVNGKQVTNLQTSTTYYNDSIFTWKNGDKIEVKVPVNHTLNNLDYVTISGFSTSLSFLNGFYQVGVTTYTSTLTRELGNFASTGIVTDIYFSSIPEEVSIGSSIKIDSEIFSILNIYKYQNVLRVSRDSSGGIHTASTPIYFIPNTFTIDRKSDYFESNINDIVYFNPKLSVGVGTTTGSGIPVKYDIGITTNRTIFVPTQSIYLPNHPFKNNQKVTLVKPGSASAISVSNTSTSSSFNLPISGNSQTVYIIKKSVDYIGIVTEVGLTTSTSGLYFTSNGTDDFQHYLQSDFSQLKGDVKQIVSTVSISTSHELTYGDKINLTVSPKLSVGIGTSTSVKVTYNNDRLLVNPITFTTSGINTSKDEITVQNHGLVRGQKVVYNASTVASGLSTGVYYVYKVTDDKIKLCETLNDCIANDPLFVNITAANGSGHKLSLINPPLYPTKNNNLVFDLTDSSLFGYNLKIFYDKDFKDEFVSTGSTNTFSISGIGTVGVSTNASLTINYTEQLPPLLFYALEKSGYISTTDKEVTDYSQISFVDSVYNDSYTISGVGTTTFNISLYKVPEKSSYSQIECSELKYTTPSSSASGGINKLRVISSGSNFKSLPIFKNVISTNGKNAYIVPESEVIGRINKIRILNEGYEYASDKTLKPETEVSKFLLIDNANTLNSVRVTYGGKNYTTSPIIILVNPENGTPIDSGVLTPVINGTSISSVIVNQKPSGLPETEVKILSINNSNGIGIQTVYSSTSSGIITCILTTPQTGFSSEPFSTGDRIFVEGIKKYGSSGYGFNSSDYQYNFFTVTQYLNAGTNLPRQIEYDTSEFVTLPNVGIADTATGIYGTIVNYNNYPRFTAVQEFANFTVGEILQVKNQLGFFEVDLKIVSSNKNYIKISGSYEVQKNDIIRGSQSGTIATIIDIKKSSGQFSISYSSEKDLGWSDDIGKLDVDTQVIADNDYYQNLSYSVKSNQRWEDIVSPVNKLLHTSGLKNFSDTQIIENVGIGITAKNYADFLYSFINENRVDAINNFDRVIDVDTDGKSSRFIKFLTKRLANYIECRTNRVLKIDDISGYFTGVGTTNSYDLNHQGIPIFVKTFDPSNSSVLDTTTGLFTISNHFFNTGEELIYSPNSSTPVGIGSTLNYVGVVTDILPSTVYAIKINNDSFKIATRKEYATADPAIAVTFTSVGIGTTHTFEMEQKSSKSIISINNIVQSPLAFSLLTYSVNNGGQVGTSSTIFGLSGISSISLGDILKIDDEYMKVINVGFGTTVSGPISFAGTFPLVSVQRGFVGTATTSHSDSSLVSLYRGSFNIVKNQIYFTGTFEKVTSIKDKFVSVLTSTASTIGVSTNTIVGIATSGMTIGLEIKKITEVIGGGTSIVSIGNSQIQIGTPTINTVQKNNLELVFGYSQTFDYNLPEPSSSFNGRVFLRKDYTTNQIFDNISERFTGIGQTYTLTSNGINTVGLGSTGGNGIVFLNGIFQTPTTKNNTNNNYSIVEDLSVGISSIVFTGITSSNGSVFISNDDVNINQLPRGGMIVSLGSTPGLGYAPLVGASVTAIVGAGGSIVSVGIGTTIGFNGNFGSGYRGTVSIAVTESGHTGSAATITATVGLGGTLSFNIVGGGTGYVAPTINISSPSYNNLPVIGVSRLGVGATTSTGTGVLLNVEVGASSTTGIGSTLFEVTGFKIVRSGYGFQKGDVITPVGLVTASGLSSPVSQFELTVLDTFTDSFSSWQFGELDYIDSVKEYQDGSRTRFPLYYNSQLISFEKNSFNADSQLIEFNSLLIIFINGILQDPGVSYQFNGGTSFTFTQPPKAEDNIAIFFYRGSAADSDQKTIYESIKIGDSVKGYSNNKYLGITTTQDIRDVVDISSSDKIQTNNYLGQGINPQIDKPLSLTWIKQKTDKILDGQIIYKSRDINEPQVYPTAKIIRNLSSSDTEIFVDDSTLFDYDLPTQFDAFIISGNDDPVAAEITAVVSSASTIQSLTIVSGGSGYVGATTDIKIAPPFVKSAVGAALTGSAGIVTDVSISYGGYLYSSAPTVRFENPPAIGVGIGSTATATANITNGVVTSVTITSAGYGYTVAPEVTFSSPGINTSTATATITNGQITSITITNPGFGYTSSNAPEVIVPTPDIIFDNIKNITGVAGSFGVITGITTAVGINTNLAIKFTLNPSPLNLSVGYPIYIYDTSVGTGVTSMDNTFNVVGVGTTFLDNIYYVSAFNSGVGIVTCDIFNTSSVVGIATTGASVGKFSWGRLYNSTRSSSPISLTVSSYKVDSGLSTFPTIQRRKSGLRDIGAIKKVL